MLLGTLQRHRAQGLYKLHASVVMPDHVHLLLSTPDLPKTMQHIIAPEAAEDIDKLLLYLAENATKRVAFETEDRMIDAFNLLARTPAVEHRRTDLSNVPAFTSFWSSLT